MKKKLTSRYIETVTAPGPKRLEVYDQTLPGFGLRVSLAGRKTWFCSTRVNRRVRRLTIGTYPTLSLADARQKAQEALRNTQLGIEPERVLASGERSMCAKRMLRLRKSP